MIVFLSDKKTRPEGLVFRLSEAGEPALKLSLCLDMTVLKSIYLLIQ